MGLSGAQRTAAYRARDPERARGQWRKWAMSEKGGVTLLLNYAQDRAKRQGVPCDLDRQFVAEKLLAGKCEVTGLPVERVAPGEHRTHPFAPSLNRVDRSGGYTKDNVRLVCYAVVRARSDWGDEALLKIARALVEKRGIA